MQAKKPIPFVAILAVVVLLASGAGWFAWSSKGAAVREKRDALAQVTSQIESLKRAAVYPSEDNVRKLSEAAAEIGAGVKPAAEWLAARRQAGEAIQGIDFQQRLRDVQARLIELAGPTNSPNYVQTPENFSFGFSRYFANLPDTNRTVQLDLQLKLTRRIGQMLFQSGIKGIEGLQRYPLEEVGGGAGAGGDGGGDTLPPVVVDRPGAAYHSLPFVVRFSGGVESLRQFLTLVGQPDDGQPVFVVRSVKVTAVNPVIPTIDALRSGRAGDEGTGGATAGAGGATNLVIMQPVIVFGQETERILCEVRLDYIEWKKAAAPAAGGAR
jgi:hypothetical protein